MESELNGERAKKRGAERLQSPERLSLSGGVWGEEPQKTNAKPIKRSACFQQLQELPKATRALRGSWPKHGKSLHQQQEPQSGASSEGKPAKAWKNHLPARTISKSRKAARALRGGRPKTRSQPNWGNGGKKLPSSGPAAHQRREKPCKVFLFATSHREIGADRVFRPLRRARAPRPGPRQAEPGCNPRL